MKLKKTENDNRALAGQAYLWDLWQNPAGQPCYLSPAWYRIAGFHAEDLITDPKLISQIIHPDDLQLFKTHLTDAYEKRLPGEVVFRIIRPDGEIRWVSHACTPVFDENGQYAGTRGGNYDITERKRAEFQEKAVLEALKKSKEMLRVITENMSDMIRVTDLQGNNIYASPSHFKGLGYTAEERIGKSGLDIVHPDDVEMIINKLTEGSTGKQPMRFEYRVRHANGHWVWLDTVAGFLRDDQGEVTALVLSSRDISDRKQVESQKEAALQALSKSEEQFRAMFEMASIGMAQADVKTGQWLRVNQKMCDITGYSSDEMLAMRVPEITHPEDRERDWEAFQNVVSGKLPDYRLEKRYIRKDGKIVWVNVNMTVVRDSAGQPIHTVATIEDITGRKRVEEELERSRDFIENVEDACFEMDLSGKLVFCNESFLKTTGYTYDEYMALPRVDLHPTREEAKRVFKIFNDVYRTGIPVKSAEYKSQRKDGALMISEVSISLVRDKDGNPVGFRGVGRDIIERKQVESQKEAALEALSESEGRFRALLKSSRDAILMMDPKGRVSYWNPAAEAMFGYTDTEAVGRNLHELIAPKRNLEAHQVAYAEFLRTGRGAAIGKTLEFQATRKDGSEITVALSLSAEWIKDGWNAIGILRDVTRQKEAEEELKEAYRRLDEIIEYLPDATFVIDNGGKVITWNRAIEQMTGVKAADMLGKSNYEYALPFYGERRPILIDLVLKPREDIEAKYVSTERRDRVLEGEAYMPALRGGEMYLFGRASALQDSKGNIVGAIESIRDITDRRRAEEKYRAIFENAVMGIFQVTPEGRIISANPAFARILGYESPEEVVNTVTDISHQMYVNPHRRAELMQILNTQGTSREEEVQYLRKDGSIVLITLSGRAVRDGAGKLLYYEGTIQDITDRRHLESQLRQAQKMEAIGTLAGGIAHDFNNILASMMGFTEMVIKETRQNVRREYLDQVLQACDRAKNLVNQILAFSRRREQELKPVDMSLILKETLSLLRASLPTTIEIKKNITREDVHVLADPTQIHQIIMNLCTNAAHAMQEKGGLLNIRLSNIEVLHPALSPHPDLSVGSYIQLSVRDTGHGIDTAIKDKIFDPFFTTKKAKEGTGLGLSVVYGIVKSYGGAINVHSFVGQGTTFTIYLPHIRSESELAETSQGNIDLRGHERILFVDDEKTLVKMARLFFHPLGYQITATTSSSEALRLFQEDPEAFDLVITDMTMPQITGADLARALLKIRPELPIILCTGYSDSIDRADARKLNIREFILKPISLNDLGLLVRRVLKS